MSILHSFNDFGKYQCTIVVSGVSVRAELMEISLFFVCFCLVFPSVPADVSSRECLRWTVRQITLFITQ